MGLIEELVAEGVAPWWEAGPQERPAVLDAVRCGFRGIRMASGTPLGAVRAACDAVRVSGGFVSVAAAAFDGADDPEAWVAAARVLRSAVDRPNVLVSVPATPSGIDTVADCLAEGIGVESTLVFSVRQYRAVLDAQGAGLERARQRGVELAGLGTAASCELGGAGGRGGRPSRPPARRPGERAARHGGPGHRPAAVPGTRDGVGR